MGGCFLPGERGELFGEGTGSRGFVGDELEGVSEDWFDGGSDCDGEGEGEMASGGRG